MLELGDDTARALGVPAERVRVGAVLVGVALAAIATASAGPIVFVALAAPQVTQRLTRIPGPNIVPTALTGAFLLCASDLIAQRLFDPTELPVGVFTGVLGGIYLAWLLSREWRKGRG
jgi:iron complex transport system permease protein